MQSALDRVTRTLVVAIGVGSVLFTILGLPGIFEQHASLVPAYSYGVIAVFCGMPPIMALLAFRAPVSTLRLLAAIHAVVTLIFLALWVPAMTVPTALEGGDLPWLVNTIAVATSEAAIAFPFAVAWAYMIVVTLVSGVIRFITFGNADASQAFQNSIMILLISGFMMALIQLTLLSGRQQDAAARIAETAATESVAADILERQRSRYQAFTRDEVLAALVTASQNTVESREYARNSAMQTLQKLDRLGAEVPLTASISAADLDVQLRTAAVSQNISYASSLSSPEGPLDIPVDVADALSDALDEAMTNSNRHAGWRTDKVVRRTVRATRLPHGVELIVKDDGRGFNPRRIGIDRLGLRLNILERLNALPGATASIVSSRGRGATVTLEWNEPRNEQ